MVAKHGEGLSQDRKDGAKSIVKVGQTGLGAWLDVGGIGKRGVSDKSQDSTLGDWVDGREAARLEGRDGVRQG